MPKPAPKYTTRWGVTRYNPNPCSTVVCLRGYPKTAGASKSIFPDFADDSFCSLAAPQSGRLDLDSSMCGQRGNWRRRARPEQLYQSSQDRNDYWRVDKNYKFQLVSFVP